MFHVYRSLVFALCSLLCLPSCIRDDSPSGEEGIRPGDRLPDFTVSLNDNTLVAASDLLGKVAVLVFFHTECPDCQKEFPVVQRLYDYYRDNSTVKIYCISREEPADEVAAYWQENGLTIPYSSQSGREVYNLFSERGIPRIYVSDKQLVVYSVYSDNPIATFEQLKSDVEYCLNGN